MRWFLRSKIHKAKVTTVNLDYEGSIGIDQSLIEKANFLRGEKILVVDNTNGSRLETYIIPEPPNSGKIGIYGAAAHLIEKGDVLTLMGFELSEKPVNAKKILVNQENDFVKFL